MDRNSDTEAVRKGEDPLVEGIDKEWIEGSRREGEIEISVEWPEEKRVGEQNERRSTYRKGKGQG